MKDNLNELFPLVDESGTVIGQATRAFCHSGSKPLHPVIHLHVYNSEGELFLQKRSMLKDIQPGKWDTSVGGHIGIGETVEEAVRREAFEELGITDLVPEFIKKYIFESEIEKELVYSFKTVYDAPICIAKDEISEGRFWSLCEMEAHIGKNVFTPNFENEYKELFSIS